MSTPLPDPHRSVDHSEHAASAPQNVLDAELIERVATSTGLSATEAARVVSDILAFYREPVQAYVRRRHAELQLHGVRNARAFALIGEELRSRPVGAPDLTERQLRRLVYG